MMTQAHTVGDIVTFGARRHPARPALRDRSAHELTYAMLEERTNRLAHALIGAGLSPGDRLAAWMADSFEYVEVYVAAAKAGLVVCPVNSRFTAHEAAYLLEDAGAVGLVWTADLDGKVADLRELGWSDGLQICAGASELSGVQGYETFLAAGHHARPVADVTPDSLFALGYTSGTTGKPKGAMLTHRSVLALARQNAFSFRMNVAPEVALTGSMSFVSVVPAHVLCTLSMGGTVTLMGKWDPDGLLHVVARDRSTFTYFPSPLLGEMAEVFARDRQPWRSLQAILHSASKASADKLAALHDIIGSRLVEGWGMTEHSGGLATVTVAGDYFGANAESPIFGSVGRSAVDVDVRLIDESGAELPHDGAAVGELVIASPGLMAGYWHRPEATADALRDGWYHTGDLGSIDAQGYVRISERRTDLIVSGGMNVYPSEVEQCIAEIPEVSEVAVVGAPDPRWGQSVVAVVVLHPGAQLSAEEVVAHCREQMASYKKPTRVLFIDDLPRTTSFKVARQELRDRVARTS